MEISSIIALFLLTIILVFFILFFLALFISQQIGVPFVPTRRKDLTRIFSSIPLSSTDIFYDLGSGNGNVVFFVAQHSQARCIGVELNKLLYTFCLFRKKYFEPPNKSEFIHEDIYATDLKQATVIYFFLYPEIVAQLSAKLLTECKKNTLIISHGFKIKNWNNKCWHTIREGNFKTYFYRV
ncbi:MAG: hypothetical protein NUV65_01340 [Candidatus Roizmanbacteria bacterium]|nr:hypothetical protein [Candidatus Roizmanbacteria bacterium]